MLIFRKDILKNTYKKNILGLAQKKKKKTGIPSFEIINFKSNNRNLAVSTKNAAKKFTNSLMNR